MKLCARCGWVGTRSRTAQLAGALSIHGLLPRLARLAGRVRRRAGRGVRPGLRQGKSSLQRRGGGEGGVRGLHDMSRRKKEQLRQLPA